MELPAEFIETMRVQLGDGFPAFIESYSRPAERGIRVNTLKISTENFKKIAPFPLEPVAWEKSGFYCAGEGLGKTIPHAAGLYYVQEPSAMCAAPELDVKSGERVLDLCSAPGGKGTQLAQYMHGEGLLVLNEVNFPRAKILSSNVERLGVKNAVVTCASPDTLACFFEEYFDKILVDAPCSGEGMFKKEPSAITEWSTANVKACAERQLKILECAFKMLSAGGRLVYSTCTFSREEDEEVVRHVSENYPVKLIESGKLYPHEVRGEGHFYALFEKTGGGRRDVKVLQPKPDKKLIARYREWERANLNIAFDNLHIVGQVLYSMPHGMPDLKVQTLRAGVRLGEFAGDRFEPSHSLAMCLDKNQAQTVEADERNALNYLKGLTFGCSAEKGWKLVTYQGYPLGWCKVTDGVAKNKLPKGVRI